MWYRDLFRFCSGSFVMPYNWRPGTWNGAKSTQLGSYRVLDTHEWMDGPTTRWSCWLPILYICITIALNSIKRPQKETCSLNMDFFEAEQHLHAKACNFARFHVPWSVSFLFFGTFFGQPATQSPSPNVESHTFTTWCTPKIWFL